EAAFSVDYPPELLSVYAVDDGSTDATWAQMAAAAKRFPLHAIRFSHNRGKRAAMAAGIRASRSEIICFVDSDSTLAPDALREIVKPFRDRRVAAVTGHAEVLNRSHNLLTRLQQVRYYVAFRVIKASEARLGLPRPADPLEEELGAGDAHRLHLHVAEESDRGDRHVRQQRLSAGRLDRDRAGALLAPGDGWRGPRDVPGRPLRDGRPLLALLRLAAGLSVLVGGHRVRRPLRHRADLADLLGGRHRPPHGLGHT